ncbi:hypothetical protein NKH18_18185 [Streptomyces sp. M10(2022)]
MSSWHRGNEHEQRLAHDRIARLLVACGLRKDDDADTGGDLGADWMSDVSESLPDTSQQQDLDLVAAAVVRQYFTRHTRTRAARPVQRWFHERAEGTADGEAALVRFCLRFHQGGDFRHAVERILLAAFIGDVADAYGTWKKVNRAPAHWCCWTTSTPRSAGACSTCSSNTAPDAGPPPRTRWSSSPPGWATGRTCTRRVTQRTARAGHRVRVGTYRSRIALGRAPHGPAGAPEHRRPADDARRRGRATAPASALGAVRRHRRAPAEQQAAVRGRRSHQRRASRAPGGAARPAYRGRPPGDRADPGAADPAAAAPRPPGASVPRT